MMRRGFSSLAAADAIEAMVKRGTRSTGKAPKKPSGKSKNASKPVSKAAAEAREKVEPKAAAKPAPKAKPSSPLKFDKPRPVTKGRGATHAIDMDTGKPTKMSAKDKKAVQQYYDKKSSKSSGVEL